MAANMDAMLRIKADVQGENNIRRLGDSIQRMQSQTKTAAIAFNGLKGAVGGFAAAITGSAIVGGLGAIVKRSVDAGDELFNLQAKTGIAATALIGLGNAAKLADVDQATLGKALTKLSVNLVKAAEGNDTLAQKFKALGVGIKDANGQVVPADRALKQIADRFADMPDGAQKAAAAVALFGKSGADLIPLLNEGAASMEKFTYKVGDDFAARSDLFNDTITELGIKTQGFGLELTDALLPALQSILEVFGDLFDTKQDWTALFDVIKFGLRTIATIIYATIKLVDQLIKFVVYSFDAIGKALQGDFEAAGRALSQGFGAGLDQARRDFEQIAKLWSDSPSPGTGRRTGGREMEPVAGSGRSGASGASTARSAAADARRAADEQERLLERRADLTQQAISLQEGLRNSVADVTAAYEGIGATKTEQLFLDRDAAITANDRLIKELTLDVVNLAKEVNAAGGQLDIKPFEDLINQLSRLNVDVAEKTYQGGLKGLAQDQADAMTALRRESGLLTQDQVRQLDINEKLAEIQREMPELYAAQKDEITALVTASAGLTEAQEQNKQLVEGIAGTIGGGIGSAFDLLIDGTENWGNSLRGIAAGVLQDIAKQLVQILVVEQAITAIRGVIGALLPGAGAGLGSAIGGAGMGFNFDVGAMTGGIPWSFAGGGYTGNGPRTGGMDGKGGFMAMLHPQETVIDHTRAMPRQGASNPINVVVNVDAKGSQVEGDQTEGAALGRVISAAVKAELVKQQRPGGILGGGRR